jgi:hypothetical protein
MACERIFCSRSRDGFVPTSKARSPLRGGTAINQHLAGIVSGIAAHSKAVAAAETAASPFPDGRSVAGPRNLSHINETKQPPPERHATFLRAARRIGRSFCTMFHALPRRRTGRKPREVPRGTGRRHWR